MHKLLTTITLLGVFFNQINAQVFKYYQTNQSPRVLKYGTSDTLLNAFAGGLNAPQFSNIDWNNDGKLDLFVYDRESLRPKTFVYDVGKAKMVYAPQYEGAFQNYFAGFALLRDYNFDGKPDLYTAATSLNLVKPEIFSVSEQIALFKQIQTPGGKITFTQLYNGVLDSGMYVPPPYNQELDPGPLKAPASGVPGIDDMDGDGDEDFLINQGVDLTFTYVENVKRNKQNVVFSNDTFVSVSRDACWGYVKYNFLNHTFNLGADSTTGFQCLYKYWGKKAKKHADQSVLLIDLNGDGIKDVIYGDYEYKNLVALINGRLQQTSRIDSISFQDTLIFSTTNTRKVFMEYPASYYVDTDGDGKKEVLVTTNQISSSRSVNNIWLFDATRVNSWLQFTEKPGTDFLYNEMIDLGLRSVPMFEDIDSDGDADLFITTSGVLAYTQNNKDHIYFYRNITNNTYPVYELVDTNFARISELGATGFFSAHPTFGDLNGDGKKDLLIGEGNGQLSYLINQGNNTFTVESRNAFNIVNGSFATPQLIDLDKDGLLDIVCGRTSGTIQYYRNIGTTTQPQFNTTPTIDSLGKVTAEEHYRILGGASMKEVNPFSVPHIADLDNNGVYDLLLGTASGRVLVYKNIYAHKDSIAVLVDSNANYIDYSLDDAKAYNKRFGYRSVPATAYLNGDTLLDIMVGNIAGGLVFLASKVEPASGVKEWTINNDAIKLYPNPAQQEIALQINGSHPTDVTWSVYDVTGKKIMEGFLDKHQNHHSIRIAELSNGIYFLRAESAQWQSTQRFVVNQ